MQKTGSYTTPFRDNGDKYRVEDFKEQVRAGAFNEDDGSGYPMKDDYYDRTISVFPPSQIPQEATHVAWFNK